MTRPITRRTALQGAGAALAVSALPAYAQTAQNMRSRAQRWLAMLDDPSRALRPFDDPLRRGWSFMHGSRVAPGLPLEDMTPEQKDAALDLLATGLSPEGFATATNIMLQQDILRDEWGKGSPDRNRERFSVLIFGNPDADGPWGWRFEGHHLSLNYTLIGDEVVSMTPSSFSSEPNTVPSGPHEGLVVLPVEDMGRRLFSALDDTHGTQARLRDGSFGNILTTAGNESRVGAPEGLALGDMDQAQIDQVTELINLIGISHVPAELVASERDSLQRGDPMATRFGWAGENRDGQSVYFRLHGDGFLYEFATLRNQPQHHHAILHDRTRNFGDHRL